MEAPCWALVLLLVYMCDDRLSLSCLRVTRGKVQVTALSFEPVILLANDMAGNGLLTCWC